MNTYVVLAGLMMIVPYHKGTGEITELKVLVLDVAAAGEQLGEEVHEHVTAVTNFGGVHAPLDGAWTIATDAPGPMKLEDSDRFLVLSRYHEANSLARVREECYGDDFAAKCVKDGHPLVKAVLTFTGGWRIRPVEITQDREPRALIVDDTWWGFVRVPEEVVPDGSGTYKSRHLPRAAPEEVQLAGGLILDPLRDNAKVSFEGPVKLEPLAPLRPAVCKLFAGVEVQCAVVRFLNTMHAISFEAGDQVQIDFTQYMMYDLLESEPRFRYLTFLRKDASPDIKKILYPGGGGTPFPRPCPPPTFMPLAEVQR
jgi:hypothetical protein